MAIRETDSGPTVAHLALLENNGWSPIPPGAHLFYRGPDPKDVPTPMLLAQVKPGKGGVKLTFLCCNNPECTRRLVLEGKWVGRHKPVFGQV
jgi:hypothetical protein